MQDHDLRYTLASYACKKECLGINASKSAWRGESGFRSETTAAGLRTPGVEQACSDVSRLRTRLPGRMGICVASTIRAIQERPKGMIVVLLELAALLQVPLASFSPGDEVAPIPPPSRSAQLIPDFRWDRVPVNIHFGKRNGELTDDEIGFIASHSELVTLEKSHGVGRHGSTEKGIAATAARLKRFNPRVKVLFYFNAFVNWPGYDAFETYRSEWTLRQADGQVVSHPSGTPRPDPSHADFREWWSEIVSQAVKSGRLDGVFADALPQSRSPALAKQLGAAKQEAVVDGLRQMLTLTKRKLGSDKIVLANGIRAGQYLDFLDWEGIDGVMIEHFDAYNSRAPEDLKADLDSMALAATKGKFVVLKGWPALTEAEREITNRSHAEQLRLARERITFPLACFLIGAQRGCHFCYAWGYREADGGLEAYPELERALGPPQTDATWNGLEATRDFAHASVWIDLHTKQARIDWKKSKPE
ncbi:MAG: putative glycoside hydrolase [Pirellulaceae bacterium]